MTESKSGDGCTKFLDKIHSLTQNIYQCIQRGKLTVDAKPIASSDSVSVYAATATKKAQSFILKLCGRRKPEYVRFIVKRIKWSDTSTREAKREGDWGSYIADINPFCELHVAKVLHENLVKTCSSPHAALLFGAVFINGSGHTFDSHSDMPPILGPKHKSPSGTVDILQEEYQYTYFNCVNDDVATRSIKSACSCVQSVTFQVLQMLAAARSHIPQFSHNDLHVNNVMVTLGMGETFNCVSYKFRSARETLERYASYDTKDNPFATVIDFGRSSLTLKDQIKRKKPQPQERKNLQTKVTTQ